MAVREIRLLGDEALRKKAVAVTEFDDELRALVDDMYDTMYEAEGAGLAAPQVGVPLRVFVFDVREITEDPSARLALVNPEITFLSDETDRDIEGCLSIPGMEETVQRPAEVTARGWTPEGEEIEISGDGLLSRVIQHEFDHLNGVLFIDRISPLKRQLLLKRYRKLLEKES
jgi:peptide deformylase